jgi:hypothetical protein
MNDVLTRVGRANAPDRVMGSTEEAYEPQRRAA